VCTSPANGVPCSNFATTYNGATTGTACSNSKQDTPQPLGSPCQAGPDNKGNIGFWAPSGTYDYTWCIGTSCFGPITVTLGSSASAGVSSLNSLTGALSVVAGSNITVTPSGSNITITGTGGGSSATQITIPTAGGTAPSGTINVLAPVGTNGNNPSGWLQTGTTAYNQLFGIDTFTDSTGGPLNPTLVFYQNLCLSDGIASPIAGKNALLCVFHNPASGILATGNQNRGIHVQITTPNPDTTSYYGVEGVQSEMSYYSTGAITGSPDGEVSNFSSSLGDFHTNNLSAPPLRMTNFRGTLIRETSGTFGSCVDCWISGYFKVTNGSTSAGNGGIMTGVLAQIGAVGGESGMGYYGVHVTNNNAFLTSGEVLYGVNIDDTGSTTNAYNIFSQSTGSGSGRNYLQGPLKLDQYHDNKEIAAPSNPASGYDRLYLDSTSHVLTCLTSSGGNCLGASGVTSVFGSSGVITTLANPTFTGTITAAAATLSGTLTVSAISGSTQCLHVNSSGVVSGTGSDCGSGGGSTAFSALTSSTNTTAAMVVGSGASLAPTSNTVGTLTANNLVFSSATIPMGTTPTNGQCLEYNGTNITGAACSGGSGSPGGSNTDVQYNSSSSFGGNAGFTYDGVSVVGIGPADSTHEGVLGLNGETSGQATFTAPAVAGTTTNPVVASNALSLPTGSTSASALQVGSSNQGLFSVSSTIFGAQMGSGAGSGLYLYQGTSNVALITSTSSAINFKAAALVPLFLYGNTTTNANNLGTVVGLGNSAANITNACAGCVQYGVGIGTPSVGSMGFAPTSGSANFYSLGVLSTINQTSTSSGNYEAVHIAITETSLKGSTNYLINALAGSSAATQEFYVDNKGNFGGNHLVQIAAGNTGGTCSMSSATTCTVTLASAFTTPVCVASQQSSGTVIAAECSVSSTTVTVTAASSNSATWGVLVFGNPN